MKENAKYKAAAFAAAVALAATVAACGNSSGAAVPAGANPTQAAKAEGSVTLYTGVPTTLTAALTAGFEKQYGITVNVVTVNSSRLEVRVEAEAASGKVGAGVILSGGSALAFGSQMVQKGIFEPLYDAKLPALANYPKKYLIGNTPGKPITAVGILQIYGLMYNSSIVKTKPTGWDSILAPQYKGKILIVSPAASAAIVDFWWQLYKNPQYGAAFFAKLRTQDLKVITTSATQAAVELAAGDGAFSVPNYVANMSTLTGAPLAMMVPSYTVGLEEDVLLVAPKKSTDPEAGWLLANYMLAHAYVVRSNDAATGHIPLTNPAAVPADLQPPNAANASHLSTVEKLLGLQPGS